MPDERDRPRPTLDVLAERDRQREYVLRAVQVEVHDLRVEFRASLRQDYLTRAEMSNTFVTREEIRQQATVRREWPLIIAGVLVAVLNAVTLIVTLRGGR